METMVATDEVQSQTKLSHQGLEKRIIRMIREIGSVEDYIDLLHFFYGFYNPLEDRLIRDHIHPTTSLPVIRYSKLILSDIIDLNRTIQQLPHIAVLPQLSTSARALGALYVMEGSTLGGKYIVQMIRQRIQLPAGKAVSFFTGYGQETEKKWLVTKDFINTRINTSEERSDFVSAANETFQSFIHWAEINLNYDRKEKL